MKVTILFFAASLIACTYHDLASVRNLGVTFSLYQGDSVTIQDMQQTTFVVKIVAISDSRCPAGFYCFTAGEATVTFETESEIFSLKINESTQVAIDHKEFQIKLLNVLPFPAAQNLEVRRQAVFMVEQVRI